MSTCSYIGAVTEVGEVGYYCNWDGHPEWMGKQLQQIVTRDGVDRVARTLLAQRQGWSQINSNVTGPGPLGDRVAVIPGYGLSYRDSRDSSPVRLIDLFGDPFVEYAYFVRPDNTIAVYEFLGTNSAVHWMIDAHTDVAAQQPGVRITRDMVTARGLRREAPAV